ncbi:DUF7146 domain-containing protein [Tardiphaga robiniae]|uniref:DUF7146 domain-containing protein n=1 Tax=Tardiphaga robiniae TaxID=943830 RepID=UPI00158687F4|nr:hypothetical protein [Tardiphaga robiniae]NUU41391.1 hypothetical protein [Tardiphaga robiniae]
MSIDLRTGQGWQDLKNILDGRPEDVLDLCRIKLPSKKGGTILIDDPRGQGSQNFAIWIKGDGLSWKNYTDSSYRGRSLELIAYCNGWFQLKNRGADEAARYAMDRLGLDSTISKEQLEKDRANAQAAREKHKTDADAELKRQQQWAFQLFVKTAVPILGTLGEVYLREARAVDLRKAPFIGPRGGNLAPAALRFIPRHKYVQRDKGGNKIGESFHPCMIACCVDADMRIVAVHQTWLTDDGSDKLNLPPAPDGTAQKARKVFPSSAGAVIPLWRGEGHRSVPEAAEMYTQHGLVETMVHTEGNEDGLSAVLAAPQYRTWPMISLSNMEHVAGRLPGFVDSVIVHQQNDWLKPAAIAQFERGMAAMRATGRMVATVAAYGGKDLNDTLRGET